MANNRKVPGSNLVSVAFAFLFTWRRSIIICQGSARCLAGVWGQRECASFGLMLCALGKCPALLAGLLPSGWASFRHRSGHRSKTTCLSALLSISKNLSGQDFHGTAYTQRITAPKTKEAATTNKAMGTVGQSSATHAGPAVKEAL